MREKFSKTVIEIHQTSSEAVPSPPCWLGEGVLGAEHVRKQGALAAINERVRFARKHIGHYEVIDFLVIRIALCYQWRTHPGSFL